MVIRVEYISMKIPRTKILQHCSRLEDKLTQRGIPSMETNARIEVKVVMFFMLIL